MKIINEKKYAYKIYLILTIFVLQISYFANVFEVLAESNIASGKYQNINWVIDSSGKLIITGTGEYYNENIYGCEYAPWIKYGYYIKSADVNITSGITSLSNMFRDCYNMTEVIFEQDFDTSQVVETDMMFYNCKNLISIDLSSLDTSNLYYTGQMFQGCEKLNYINFTNFNTSKVNDMGYMFNECKSLVNLDVSNFKTSNVINMISLFNECTKLENIDLSNWDVSNVIYAENMFYGCTQIKNINLSNWNINNLEYLNSFFEGCSNLTYINLSNFNTSRIGSMDKMFKDCINLTSLDLSSFNTNNVSRMQSMFENCQSLKNINVSNFNIANTYDIDSMFKNCISLESINLFQTGTDCETTSMNELFKNCIALKNIDMSNCYFNFIYEALEMFEGDINLSEIKAPRFAISYDYQINLPSIDGKKWVDKSNIFNRYTEMRSGKVYISLNIPNIGDIFLTSDIYNIGNNKVYEADDQYFTNVVDKTTVADFKKNIKTNGSVTVFNTNGEIQADNIFIGNDMSVKIFDDSGSILLKFIVRGDIDGNGKITITDATAINEYLLETITLRDERKTAADIDNSGSISITDLSTINQYIVGSIPSL